MKSLGRKFHGLSSSERILTIDGNLTKLQPTERGTFWEETAEISSVFCSGFRLFHDRTAAEAHTHATMYLIIFTPQPPWPHLITDDGLE